MKLVLIAAMADNRVIGIQGRMPWHLSEDLKRFKRLTMGHTIIMGRKTWDSIGRPLPGRENVVITRSKDLTAAGALVVGSLEEAIEHARAKGDDTAFIVGGGEIYRMALPMADRLELTLIHRTYDGDARFPEYDAAAWRETAREDHEASEMRYSFVTLERK